MFSTQPNLNDTITIAGKVYTFQTTLTNVDGHVHIGPLVSDTISNLVNAVNATGSTGNNESPFPAHGDVGVDYATATTANASVTARVGPVADPVTGITKLSAVFTAKASGTAGNSLTLAKSSSSITLSGSTLTGGSSGIAALGQQNIVSWYGGYVSIEVTGVFGGASVQLQACSKAPANLATLAATDWLNLGAALTANGVYQGYLNPCLLSATLSSVSGTTALRITAQPASK